MASCCRWPPESRPARRLDSARNAGNRSSASATDSLPRLRPSATSWRFSAVVRCGKDCWPCGTYAIPRATRSCGLRRVMSSPSRRIVPLVGVSSPTAARSSVLLPAPLCPSTAATPSLGTSTETPCRTELRW
ncbi:hypothetical protein ADL12_01170 [Streptomyces regalis]|uniref:Uncharacterized protein n=1 Tax=Streptomyces regalis TaxID=68262 RepID=A0A0X3VTR3_9ACTN|nr:hypothetical protein ADL12_01170 [Streptomyces regalis]